MDLSTIEIFGYVSSVIVAISLSMINIKLLRQLNFIGSSSFAVYGFVIGAYPVMVLNAYIAIINIYYLVGMYKKKDHFSLVPAKDNSSEYLNKFLDFYKADINKFFPNFKNEELELSNCYFILRDLRPVGLFAYNEKDNAAEVKIDYAIPEYRDYKNGEYIYNSIKQTLKPKGINTVFAISEVEDHIKYLNKLGFIRNQNQFEKNL